MSDSEKPFACPSPGCNMSFTNEDHLVVHRKKHDMILNLGAAGKSGSFVADQTPTPTRFIRNCEEVGLFQDLQNVNPFEETFRRAVESGKIGGLPETEIGTNDDTLHTPHVFPHIEDPEPSPSNRAAPHADEAEESLSDDTGSVKRKKKDDSSETTKSITTTKRIRKTTETIVIQEADTSIIPQGLASPSPTSLSINGEEVQLFLKIPDGKVVQLSAIPVCDSSSSITSLQTQQTKSKTIVVQTEVPLKASETLQSEETTSPGLSLAKMRLRQVLTKNDSNVKIEKVSIQNNINNNTRDLEEPMKDRGNKCADVDKKQAILARNRASSMRSRAKRKEWIQELQMSVNNVNRVNTTLQDEIKLLRSEVARLKTLLLAHKDCSVTKAMENDNSIVVEPEVIRLSTSQFNQAASIPILEAPTQGVKRKIITNQVPIAAKQKPLVTKSKILLPKIDETPIATKMLGNPCATVKIIDLGQMHNEKCSSDKSIFIVQHPPQRQIQVINSRQIVQVDHQSLQLINVASKTTGT